MRKFNSINERLVFASENKTNQVLDSFETNKMGITNETVKHHSDEFGKNIITKQKKDSILKKIFNAFINPFTAILLILAVVSLFTNVIFAETSEKDPTTVIIIVVMVMISGILRFIQEQRSGSAAEKLIAMISNTTNIKRYGQEAKEIPIDEVVVGDIVYLSAGDMIPGDLRIIEAKDLFISQASLTGESEPVEKFAIETTVGTNVLEAQNLAFMGSDVISGSAVGVVIATGDETMLGRISIDLNKKRELTTFEIGINSVSWLLIRFMLVMVPVVLFINGFTNGDWLDASLFALSVAVGLTPEMLPMIVTTSLAKGSLAMAKEKTIIKNLNSIQNLGAIDILCTDKTGTLTKAEPTVLDIVSFNGMKCKELLRIAACLEEHFPHSMAKAVVQAAVDRNLVHEELHSEVEYIVAHGISSMIENKKVVIGSYHFVFEDEQCTIPEGKEELFEKLPEECSHLYMAIEGKLAGVICIEDPLREEAKDVIKALKAAGIKKVVMMTGDSDRTAKVIAAKVGVDEYHAEVLPEDKAAFVEKEKAEGRKVIMIGDGINDSPALSASNVGIAISDGAQIAREIADVTIEGDHLHGLVTLKHISNHLMRRIHNNYRFIVGFNAGLIGAGVLGFIQPTTSAVLHNTSTLCIGLRSMKNLVSEEELQ